MGRPRLREVQSLAQITQQSHDQHQGLPAAPASPHTWNNFLSSIHRGTKKHNPRLTSQAHTQDSLPPKYWSPEDRQGCSEGHVFPKDLVVHQHLPVPVHSQCVSVSWVCIQGGRRKGPEGPTCAPLSAFSSASETSQ